MRVRFQEFASRRFAFHKDPVLVLEEFWSPKDMAYFQEAMNRSQWKALADMPEVSQAFPNCGNWIKAEMAPQEGAAFLERLALDCIHEYIESFPNIKQRHMNFSYYSYAAGDCLSTHNDTEEGYSPDRRAQPALRRVALVTYMHSEWSQDWGGELILYETRKNRQGELVCDVSQCIAPQPGSLVLFTVPRYHRVCRVDPLAGSHKRLSIAGWFMTEHET
jgi:SM-20-related protein